MTEWSTFILLYCNLGISGFLTMVLPNPCGLDMVLATMAAANLRQQDFERIMQLPDNSTFVSWEGNNWKGHTLLWKR